MVVEVVVTGMKGEAATDMVKIEVVSVSMVVCWMRGDQNLDCALYRQTVYPAVCRREGNS